MATTKASSISTKQPRYLRVIGLVWACILACSLSLVGASAGEAHADVRKGDVIAGLTVEDRDLSVAECPSVEAERVILVDEDGTPLFERNSTDKAQIASITKVMTAMVAIDNRVDDSYIAVSERAATVGESSASLMEGDTLDFDSALKALLVPSGNDAAVALAEAVGTSMINKDPSLGNDPTSVFVSAMNKKAEELGLADTLYENPHGLDADEFAGNLHSTAADQAIVARAALEYPEIAEIVAGGSTTIPVTRDGSQVELELETTDELLEMYKFTIGIKTGITELAGPSFMGAAEQDGMRLYAVVLDSLDEAQRFEDCKTLFIWGYDHLRDVALANSGRTATMTVGQESREVPVIAAVSHADWVNKTVNATFADPDMTVKVFDLEGNISQSLSFNEIHGDVHAGDVVGHAVFKQHNLVVAEQDLVACEDVPAPAGFDVIGTMWDRFVGGFSGQPEAAQSETYNVMPIIANNVTNAGA